MNAQENRDQIPIPINTVVLHTRFHLDEAMALYLLHAYGDKFFPGVCKAKVKFTMGLRKADDATFDQRGILPLGCGGGRFDEHRVEGERLPGECAATLVARYLGIQDDSYVSRMVAEALRCDTKAGVKRTELAELIKMANRRIDENSTVLAWTMKLLHALHTQLFVSSAKVKWERSLLLLVKSELATSGYEDAGAREFLQTSMEESVRRKADSITELAFLTECLYRTDSTDKDIGDFVKFALRHYYTDQLEFQKAVEECKANGEWFSFSALCNRKRHGERTRSLKGLIIRTDSPLVQRAARTVEAGGASVVIVQKKTGGNTSVFVDASKGINIVAFTRMIRWTELLKDEKDSVSWENLGNGGALPEVPHWYFFKKGQMLLNGSLTHTSVKATDLHPDAIKEMAKDAFHPKNVVRWMRARGIQIPTKESAGNNIPRPQPTPATQNPHAKAEVKTTPRQAPPTPPPTPPAVKVEESEAERLRKDLELALNGNQIPAS